MDPARSIVTLDFGEVHNNSVDLLKLLENNDVEISEGAAALGLSFGRLMSPDPMTDEGEIMFIQALFEWAGAYFAEGGDN